MIEYQYAFQRGDVTYTLTVTQDERGYRGKYVCHACNMTAEIDRRYSSETEAAAKLQAVVYAEHHAPVHVIG